MSIHAYLISNPSSIIFAIIVYIAWNIKNKNCFNVTYRLFELIKSWNFLFLRVCFCKSIDYATRI